MGGRCDTALRGILFFSFKFKVFTVPLGRTELLHNATTGLPRSGKKYLKNEIFSRSVKSQRNLWMAMEI